MSAKVITFVVRRWEKKHPAIYCKPPNIKEANFL
jgi:hypothetical protein